MDFYDAQFYVTHIDEGCTCGGMAACQQCQERDAQRGTVVILKHPHDEDCERGQGGEVCTCGLDDDLMAMFEAGRAKGLYEALAAGFDKGARMALGLVLECAETTQDFVKAKGLHWAADRIRAALGEAE